MKARQRPSTGGLRELPRMNVRRVRLISEPPVHGEDCALRVPRARRARVLLDRMRVRSIWLSALEMPEVRTGWHGGGSSSEGGGRSAQIRSSRGPGRGRRRTTSLPGLRELLRPSVRAVMKRERSGRTRFYPFQEEGVLFLYERPGRAARRRDGPREDGPSAGRRRASSSPTEQIRQALVLCPAPLVLNWLREARRWLPRLHGGHRDHPGRAAPQQFLLTCGTPARRSSSGAMRRSAPTSRPDGCPLGRGTWSSSMRRSGSRKRRPSSRRRARRCRGAGRGRSREPRWRTAWKTWSRSSSLSAEPRPRSPRLSGAPHAPRGAAWPTSFAGPRRVWRWRSPARAW